MPTAALSVELESPLPGDLERLEELRLEPSMSAACVCAVMPTPGAPTIRVGVLLLRTRALR